MRYIVVGNGITGASAAEVIRQRDDAAEIVMIGDESEYFYSRTALMWVYMHQLQLRDLEPRRRRQWDELRIERVLDRVTAIDREARRLTLERGKPLAYDRLLLAVGGTPNLFGWPGQDLDGVCTMTSLRDLDRLEAVRPRLKRAVVVGGGLIGVELAEMMVHDKVPVTYLIREPWYWNLALSEAEARLAEAQMRDHGVDVVLEDELAEIKGDSSGRVKGVLSKKGEDLPCEMVGIAVGVHANTELARGAGLDLGRGIVVNGSLQTSDPNIFAAGDAAEVRLPGREQPLLQKLWYTGQKQGVVAGQAMLGDTVTYDPGMPYNSAQFFFLDFVTVGWMPTARPELSEWSYQARGARDSIRISHNKNKEVQGFSMLGSRWNAATMMRWIRQRRTLPWVLSHLSEAVFDEEFRQNRFAGLSASGVDHV